jgi:hypothetical protein
MRPPGPVARPPLNGASGNSCLPLAESEASFARTAGTLRSSCEVEHRLGQSRFIPPRRPVVRPHWWGSFVVATPPNRSHAPGSQRASSVRRSRPGQLINTASWATSGRLQRTAAAAIHRSAL